MRIAIQSTSQLLPHLLGPHSRLTPCGIRPSTRNVGGTKGLACNSSALMVNILSILFFLLLSS